MKPEHALALLRAMDLDHIPVENLTIEIDYQQTKVTVKYKVFMPHESAKLSDCLQEIVKHYTLKEDDGRKWCPTCGSSIKGKRKNKRFCSTVCKQKAHNLARRATKERERNA